MKTILMFFWIFLTCITNTYAVESLPTNLINFQSQRGLLALKNGLNINSLKLLEHFTTQKNLTYCSVASAVMVLNAANREAPLDLKHPPHHYFTQDNFFNNNVTKIITSKEVKQNGMELINFSKVMQSYGLEVQIFYANDLQLKSFRKILTKAILNRQFIVVNFSRVALHEIGGGHFSPIAAYDEQSDRFLLLDVSRYKYPAYWVTAADLFKAINTKDMSSYRGFVIIKA